MNISRDNYEPFFLDFLEGNLKVDQIDQFLDFLNQNPDLKEELQLFESVNLPEEEFIFSGKMQLYRRIADQKSETENRVIAYLEGDLSSEDQILFQQELASHPELKKEYDLFDKTRLIADTRITYSGKRNLHRKSGTVKVMNWVTRVAAVMVLVWGITSLFQSENELERQLQNQPIAELSQEQIQPIGKPEAERKATKTALQMIQEKVMLTKAKNSLKIQKYSNKKQEENLAKSDSLPGRDSNNVPVIEPILAQLESIPIENQLVNLQSIIVENIYDAPQVLSLDEFLANKAKKVSTEGLISAQRIARAGLSMASDLSGERIGFVEKNGKIDRIEFESKLFAFSIPFKKK
jgi:hypothetical protein